MASQDVVHEAVKRLTEALPPAAQVILFGSHAHGTASADSDIDFMVVEREVESRFGEAVRLRAALRGLGVPIDVLVFSRKDVDEWSAARGSVIHEAVSKGRVVAET